MNENFYQNTYFFLLFLLFLLFFHEFLLVFWTQVYNLQFWLVVTIKSYN